MELIIYTTQEIAAILKVSVKVVLTAIKNGKLAAKKVGKSYRVTQAALTEFWENR